MKFVVKIHKNFIYKLDVLSSTIYCKGPLGLICLKYNNFISFINNSTYFIKKNFIKKFYSFIKNSLIGLNFGFFTQLEVFGLGYKVINERSDLNLLCLDLGCTHWIYYKLNSNIFAIIKDKFIYLYGTDLSILNSQANQIRQIRYLTPYKPKGIKFFDEVLVVKQTKQK